MSDLISRADAIEAVKSTKPIVRSTERNWGKMIAEQHSKDLVKALKALPSADVVSREVYDTVCAEYNRLVHNAICVKLCDENCEYEKGKTCYHAREHYLINSIVPSVDRPTPNCITESANDADEKNDEVIERPIIEHDREWIIGCIKHDGFIKTDRFDKANNIIVDALESCDRPSGEWIFEPKDAIELMFTKPKCSVCGFESADGLHYCPSCGARMENTKMIDIGKDLKEAYEHGYNDRDKEIVRCKDCKYWHDGNISDINTIRPSCELNDCEMYENDFCSWGERRAE